MNPVMLPVNPAASEMEKEVTVPGRPPFDSNALQNKVFAATACGVAAVL